MRTEIEIARQVEATRQLLQKAIERHDWAVAVGTQAQISALQWVLNDR